MAKTLADFYSVDPENWKEPVTELTNLNSKVDVY